MRVHYSTSHRDSLKKMVSVIHEREAERWVYQTDMREEEVIGLSDLPDQSSRSDSAWTI